MRHVSALAGHHLRPPGPRLRRVLLVTLMAVTTVNIWTGGPLLALWIGSRVQGDGPPSMLAVGVAAVSLGVITYVLVRLLARIDAAYGRAAGRKSGVNRHVPWLRSMRGERPHKQKHASELSPLEVVLVTTVVVVVVLFEVWFFFFSGSPIDQRSGRDHKAPIIGALDFKRT
jgi:hypothetical protein